MHFVARFDLVRKVDREAVDLFDPSATYCDSSKGHSLLPFPTCAASQHQLPSRHWERHFKR